MLEARLSRRAFCVSGSVRRGARVGGCRGNPQGRRESGGIRHPWDASRQNPSPLGSLAAAVRTACHGSVRRRRKQVGPVALEQSRGKKRPPRAAARQLPHRDAARAREGDGNQPESVALGAFRGRIRPPRQLSRHLPCGMSRNRAKATEIGRNPSPLGHLTAESVPLGGSCGSCARLLKTLQRLRALSRVPLSCSA